MFGHVCSKRSDLLYVLQNTGYTLLHSHAFCLEFHEFIDCFYSISDKLRRKDMGNITISVKKHLDGSI